MFCFFLSHPTHSNKAPNQTGKDEPAESLEGDCCCDFVPTVFSSSKDLAYKGGAVLDSYTVNNCPEKCLQLCGERF